MDCEEKDTNYSPNNDLGSTLSNKISNAVSPVSDVSLDPEYEEISIYDVWSKSQHYIIISTLIAIGFTLPFCDTMYLPALNSIARDLDTSYILVALTASIYLFMSAIGSLVWGSASDRFGRKRTLIVSLIVFVTASIVCIFAPNIIVLIIFRAIEGGAIAATLVIGQTLMADVFHGEKRAMASTFFFVPYSTGSVVGPLIGGPLSNAFGWRSTFVFLSILSFCLLIFIIIALPETHQYLVKVKFHKEHPNKRITDVELNELPQFGKPWAPLLYLGDLTILPYISTMGITFATSFAGFVLFPSYLDASPYNYSAAMIGVLFVPFGVGMFLGNINSGWLTDLAAKRFEKLNCIEGRLLPSMILSFFCPIGLIIFGWTFQYKVNLAGPIVGGVLFSFGQAVLEPSVSTYLTARKQKEAGTVSATNAFLTLLLSSIFVSTATPLNIAMHTGSYFSFLFAINMVILLIAMILIYNSLRQARHSIQQESDETHGLIKNEIK